MEAAVEYLTNIFNGIRSNNRSNTDFLAFIKVLIDKDWLPLQHLALISLSGHNCFKIEPYGKEWAMPIEKAINEANLGVTTDRHKDIIFVRLPSLNRETREKYVKIAKDATEKQKIAIRNIRREARTVIKDDKVVENLTKKYIEQIESMLLQKTNELLSI